MGVPNIMNFGISQIQNAHVYYFNPFSFKYFVESSELSMIDYGSAHGGHIYGIFKNAKTIPNNNYLLKSKNLMYKRLKRKYYLLLFATFLKKIGLYNLVKSIQKLLVNKI